MTVRRFALPPSSVAPMRSLPGRMRTYLLHRRSGRVLLGALAILALEIMGLPLPDVVTVFDRIALFGFGSYGLYRLGRYMVRAFLWRIRTRLLVSYVFIAVVPLVLLAVLFGIASVLFCALVAGHMLKAEVRREVEALGMIVSASGGGTVDPAGLERRLGAVAAMHPKFSFALVRGGRLLASRGDAPRAVPDWVGARGDFAGLVKDGELELLRAVSVVGDSFLVVQIPLDVQSFRELEAGAGIRLLTSGGTVHNRAEPGSQKIDLDVDTDDARLVPGRESGVVQGIPFVALVDRTDWVTGKVSLDPLSFSFDLPMLVERMSSGSMDVADILVRLLAVVAVVFLVCYFVALLIGLLLARSITGSVHALSMGTERLRQGDFTTLIEVRGHDQLGELAQSFNVMALGIQDLLRESAEKERLEEELRIARQIQMRLLPQGVVTLPGLRIAALCLPATEVGGDYYDLLPLSTSRMAVLVADVSGKGTSAALYMAELKGLVLSLSRMYESPARLLGEANRILATNMDSRSFITMTYAVVDTESRTMCFARAGHNPLIHLEASTGLTRVLTPPGLGLGMDLGDKFEQILEEVTVPLRDGDIFLLFTDGLSEAMNGQAELFGETRLREVVERNEGMDSEQLKEAILGEIRSFVGGAAQHDDMTLVVLKVVA